MSVINLKPARRASGVAVTAGVLAAVAFGLSGQLVCHGQTHLSGAVTQSGQNQATDPQQQLLAASSLVKQSPSDPKAHFGMGEAFKKAGRQTDAAQEYLQATALDPAYYVAYHALTTISAEPAQYDEAINRLNKLKDEKPKDLMLRVALSELLEKVGKFYQGARVLVDLEYQNAVPDKYLAKVNARIHYLLVKSKDSQETDRSAVPTEDELDTLPPPLPEATLHKDLTSSRLKESRVMRGVGHAPLLP